ncbi:MarR family winged helix-turn-helix transcriptional regulator [Catenulispora rubra]|uniref:MarR family winged helix-turn-helix transcriptional regulator n=1 Tax=Catenulispora rubra TaxID=280293 RepID=UPI0018923341|nr:MarR family transcriptional regulator [Catenulispora rubra]
METSGLDRDVEEVTAAVLSASRLLVALSARALADVDDTLTLPQLRTLAVLAAAGPVKLAALAATLGVNPSTAMRMVGRLEAAGRVHRHPNPDNRREVTLTLTPAGQRLVDQVMDHRHAEISKLVAGLPAGERSTLVKALRAFTAAAAGPFADSPDHPGLLLTAQRPDHPAQTRRPT